MQSNLATMLQRAEEGKYAVIAFNYSDLWDLKGILRAAEEERAPIMVAAVPAIYHNHGVKIMAGAAKAAAESTAVPVVPHLDHSNSQALCMDVIDHGLRSVMIDGSHLPFQENVSFVKPVVDYAHARGVHVEGELGRIKGANWEGVFVDGSDFLTDVREAVEFIRQTGVDSLAVGIGSGHGFYTETPHLDIQRLSEIKAATGAKLVLHGGTGLPEEQIKDAIKNGINKINVGTLIYTSYLTTLKKTLNTYQDQGYSLQLFDDAVAAVTEAARGWIRIVGASGKA